MSPDATRAVPASSPLRISLISAMVSCSRAILALKFSRRLPCAGSLAGCARSAARLSLIAARALDRLDVHLVAAAARDDDVAFDVGEGETAVASNPHPAREAIRLRASTALIRLPAAHRLAAALISPELRMRGGRAGSQQGRGKHEH